MQQVRQTVLDAAPQAKESITAIKKREYLKSTAGSGGARRFLEKIAVETSAEIPKGYGYTT